MKIKGVLFDIDGTIFDHAAAERAGLRRYLTEIGRPADEAELDRWVREVDVHYDRFLAGEITFIEQRLDRVRAFFGEQLDDPSAQRWFDGYQAAYVAAWALYDDVLPALDALDGVRIGIVSNSSTDWQEFKLDRLGIRDRFSCLLCASELGVAKPDARAFHAGCSALGLAPDEVIYIGDMVDVDAHGARDAGLRSVLVDRAGVHEPPHDGYQVVSSLVELPSLTWPV